MDLGLDKIDFDNAFVIAALEKVGIVKYIIIPIMIIINFVQLIIYSLLISLVGLLSNLIGNRKISYRELFNLSLYAVTLPAIINLIYWWIFYFRWWNYINVWVKLYIFK